MQAYWLAEGQLFIVMDLADRNLNERLEECRANGLSGIPVDELLQYMREVAEALDYLHSNQVLHRDIKPANIMLAGGHAKLTDFGLARLMIEKGSDIHATTTGTPLYMSPEVWGNKVGPGERSIQPGVDVRRTAVGAAALSSADVRRRDAGSLKHQAGPEAVAILRAAGVAQGLVQTDRKNAMAVARNSLRRWKRPCRRIGVRLRLHRRGRRVLTALVLGGLAAAAGLGVWQWAPWNAMAMTVPASVTVEPGVETDFEVHISGAGASSGIEPKFANVPVGLTLKPVASNSPGSAAQGVPLVWRVLVTSEVNLPDSSHGKSFTVTVSAAKG